MASRTSFSNSPRAARGGAGRRPTISTTLLGSYGFTGWRRARSAVRGSLGCGPRPARDIDMPLAPRSADAPADDPAPLRLSLVPGRFAICRLPAASVPPSPPPGAALWSLTRSAEELSLVLPEEYADRRWRV